MAEDLTVIFDKELLGKKKMMTFVHVFILNIYLFFFPFK